MVFNVDDMISQCYAKQLLPAPVIKELCEKIKEILINESNIRQIKAPVTVVGDVHGQFHDLMEIFCISGFCPSTNYVFLGDYVDRGYHSVEVITLLCCLKLRYPNRVALIRGNHESRAVTSTYGFYTECTTKYGDHLVWKYFTDLFDYMVLAVEIENQILCVHGGLSPSIHVLDQIRAIDRFREIPHEGPMADLVWSDPVPPGTAFDGGEYFAVSPRGAGYVFGQEVVNKFLSMNQLVHICRAHQLCMEGYQILFNDQLSTVWSAPNYCYRAGNLASVLEISPSLERYFNVFGPCPDEYRDKKVIETPDRLAGLFDIDKKQKPIVTRSARSHSLRSKSELLMMDQTNLDSMPMVIYTLTRQSTNILLESCMGMEMTGTK